MAITFFNAPPSSAPVTSVLRYSRKLGVESCACRYRPAAASAQAKLNAVGEPAARSVAKLGPVNTAACAFGACASSKAEAPLPVARSIPLQQLTRYLGEFFWGNAERNPPSCCIGTASRTISAAAHSAKSAASSSASGNPIFGNRF